jgi:hypothetical protein
MNNSVLSNINIIHIGASLLTSACQFWVDEMCIEVQNPKIVKNLILTFSEIASHMVRNFDMQTTVELLYFLANFKKIILSDQVTKTNSSSECRLFPKQPKQIVCMPLNYNELYKIWTSCNAKKHSGEDVYIAI